MQHSTMPPPQVPPPGHGRPPIPFAPTQLRVGRVLGLLVLAGLFLAGAFLLVLFVHGKTRTREAIQMATSPPWLNKTDIYAPGKEDKAEAPATPSDPYGAKIGELLAKMASLEASVNDLKKRKAGTTTTVINQQSQKAATVPTKPKAAAPLFITHDLKDDKPTLTHEEYTLAPGATKIPCTVETVINSQVEGYFTCKVNTNVYDTKTGMHLLVPQGSTVLAHDQSRHLIYGDERLDTVSLTLTLPDGRSVDLGKAPVTDQAGVAGLTGDVNNHWWRLFGAVFIGGALKGGMSAMNVAMTEAAGAGQVASGIASVGNQATNRVIQPYINTRPTITVEAGQLGHVLLIKPLTLPAMWQGAESTETAQAKTLATHGGKR
jgi:type IV secretory pathway VirB10-like protein